MKAYEKAVVLFKDRIFVILFIITAGIAVYFSLQGWDGSLLEQHSFRQTQTAITVKYLLNGGSFIRYETPVLGAPWSIPFEFPFYQYLVYLLVKATGYSLDQAGRIVSLILYISFFYPLRILICPFYSDRSRTFISLSLLCTSSQYLYWSRTFMIESTALALSIWYLYFIRTYLGQNTPMRLNTLLLVAIACTGTIAAITKVTTFPPYLIIGVLLFMVWLSRENGQSSIIQRFKVKSPFLFVSVVLPLAAVVLWTHYSDQVKSLNPLGSLLMSKALTGWNFGIWDQKLSWVTWKSILHVSLNNLLGSYWLLIPLSSMLLFCCKRTVLLVCILVTLWLLPVAIFTNLHFIHNYYAYANGIILLAAAGLIIGEISMKGTVGYLASIAMITLIVTANIQHYYITYLPSQGATARYQEMKKFVDLHTKHDDVLIFYGAGWTSEFSYYLDRRSLMLANWMIIPENSERYARAIDNLRAYNIGAVIFCGDVKYDAEKQKNTLSYLQLPNVGETVSADGCNAYFPQKEHHK